MSPNQIAGLAGVLLSLLFSYAPGFSTWYAAKDTITKSLLMAALVVLAGIGALVYTCEAGAATITLAVCLQTNWITYAGAIGYALVLNQSTFIISPSKAVVVAAIAAKAAAVPPAPNP